MTVGASHVDKPAFFCANTKHDTLLENFNEQDCLFYSGIPLLKISKKISLRKFIPFSPDQLVLIYKRGIELHGKALKAKMYTKKCFTKWASTLILAWKSLFNYQLAYKRKSLLNSGRKTAYYETKTNPYQSFRRQ